MTNTNIVVHNVKFRGYNFSMIPGSSKKNFFSLKSLGWFEVDTTTSKTNYAFRHGAKMGGTYNQPRVFTLNFDAIAENQEERYKLIRLVNAIFSPPSNPSIYNDGYYDLEFTTPDGAVWTTKVKTTSRPRMFDYDNDKWIGFEAKLTTKENSMLYSKNPYILSDTNSMIGTRLKNTLPTVSKYRKSYINYAGVSDSPVNVKIVARKNLDLDYIYIRSFSNDALSTTLDIKNISILEGDYIFIDSYNQKITKSVSGVESDITSLSELNSEFPYISNIVDGDNVFMAVDCGRIEEVLDVEYSYYDIWE